MCVSSNCVRTRVRWFSGFGDFFRFVFFFTNNNSYRTFNNGIRRQNNKIAPTWLFYENVILLQFLDNNVLWLPPLSRYAYISTRNNYIDFLIVFYIFLIYVPFLPASFSMICCVRASMEYYDYYCFALYHLLVVFF